MTDLNLFEKAASFLSWSNIDPSSPPVVTLIPPLQWNRSEQWKAMTDLSLFEKAKSSLSCSDTNPSLP